MSATQFQDNTPRNSFGRLPGDERLLVTFSTVPVESNVRSLEEGRPMYDDRIFIQIIVPGDQYTIKETIATEEDFHRFAVDYDRFKAGQADVLIGTPLKEWPAISPSQIKELEYLNIRTVEALAELGDELVRRHGGTSILRSRAQAWLKSINENGFALKQQAELEKRDAQISALMEQMATLSAAVEAKTTKATKA